MTFRALCVTALLASACAQIEEQTYFEGGKEVSTAYATKVVNSEDEADAGTLIVVLDEKTADVLANGGNEPLLDAACEAVDVKSVERLFVSNNALARQKGLHKWYLITFNGERNPSEMAETFAALSCVEHVQYNTVVYREYESEGSPYRYTPKAFGEFDLPYNDPLLPDQWHYVNNVDISVAETSRAGADINVKNAWKLCSGDPKIIVAVCDEGVKYSHPDLVDNMWVNEGEIPGNGIDDDENGYVDDIHGWNFLSTTDYPKTLSWAEDGDKGHGTHVAGTVAAVNQNGMGVSGVAGGSGNGDGVKIMSCQVFSGNSSATVAARAKAYEYAANNGACILQCSFGLSGGMVTSDGAFELSYGVEKVGLDYFFNYRQSYSPVDKNFVIFAAGNDGYHLAGYPAAHREYISVSAIGPDFLPAVYTNYGPGCKIAAPGGEYFDADNYGMMILSTGVSNAAQSSPGIGGDRNYVYMQGTSMACPHVSGVVALGISYAKKLGKKFSRDEFQSLLLTSVNELDGHFTGTKDYYDLSSYSWTKLDLSRYQGKMGTGAVDAWKFLMAIEGTPTIMTQAGKKMSIDISRYCNPHDEYTITVDAATKTALGLSADPVIRNGRLEIECSKIGSGKITLSGAVGKDTAKDNGIGEMSYSRELSIASRPFATNNGGWL